MAIIWAVAQIIANQLIKEKENKMEFDHVPVLLNETIEGLNIKPDGIYIDGTLGGAGHSEEILKRLKNGKLIGIDQDIDAIKAATQRLDRYKDKIIIINDNYVNIPKILEDLKIKKVDGIILDIGVSSYQLDQAERGFSYQHDAPLDMRMNKENKFCAYDVINNYSEDKLSKVIFQFGEERWAKRIAQFIVKARGEKAINTTLELVEIIKKAIPQASRREGPHPAKRTFQAIRIEVNNELGVLKESIKGCINLLNKGGRMCIITFHSLEDRIVKEEFLKLSNPCTCPPQFPICVCNKKSIIKVIAKKPICPSEEELSKNPRARSSKLRIAEKL